MYVVTSIGVIYLVECFNNSIGILIIILPVTIGFLWGVLYFEKLEQEEERSYYRKINACEPE